MAGYRKLFALSGNREWHAKNMDRSAVRINSLRVAVDKDEDISHARGARDGEGRGIAFCLPDRHVLLCQLAFRVAQGWFRENGLVGEYAVAGRMLAGRR